MPAARKGGPSALVIFGGAMAAGLGLAVVAVVMLTGDAPRRSRRASTDDHASAAGPRRRSTPPASAADAPPETTDVAALASPAGGTTGAVPTPPPSPQVAPPAADAPPAALALGSAARDKKAEEEYFAKLRRESEERHARETEARAAREAKARAEREASDRASREAKERAEREAGDRAARAARMKPVIEKNAQWNYLAGAHPRGKWTRHDYRPLAEHGWRAGPAGFGYGDNDDRTVLKNMRHKYTVVYIRRPFSVADPGDVKALELVINYDDGFIAYLNGKEVARAGVPTGSGVEASGMVQHEQGKFERFQIKDLGRLLRRGRNVFAIEGHNTRSSSSDFSLDPYLEGLIESASP
ncbi:MAG: hypothetical protein ACYSU0_21845 [Planctomycetota bacterium]|jgi:hypothetical protein